MYQTAFLRLGQRGHLRAYAEGENAMLWFDKRNAGGLALLFCLSAVLSGCSGEGDFAVKSLQSIQTEVEIPASGGTEAPAQGKELSSPGQKDNSQETSGSRKNPLPQENLSLQELPQAVFQTNDGKLLLLGDKAILMDASTLETEICKEITGLAFSFQDINSCKFAESEEEYLVVGNLLKLEQIEGSSFFSSSEEPQMMLIRFSKSLDILETLNIGEAMGASRAIDKYSFIDKGTKLLCSSMEGFFLYELKTKNRTIYPLDESLRGIYSFGYLGSQDKILFAGFYDDGTQADYQCVLGSMGMDGKNLEYEKKQTHEWGEIKCFEDFALIEDAEWNESGERANLFYYGADGKLEEWLLADEYAGVQASETGKYFAVQSRDWAENGESTGYTVRLYASDGGGLLQEIPCPFSEIGQNTMLCQCIVSESAGAVFLLMCDRETEENPCFHVVYI